MKETINYEEAFTELQEIVNALEVGEISVDDLETRVKRATTLIRICRKKLTTTEQEVNRILKELDEAE